MTVKKYQFYIDTKKQQEFYEEKFKAKYLDKSSPSNKEFFHLIKNDSNYFQTVHEITVNSGNKIVKDLFERNQVPLQSFFYVYRNYKKVKIYFWDVKEENDLPNNSIITDKSGFFQESKKEIYNNENEIDTFYIIEMQNSAMPELLAETISRIKTPFKNLLFLQRIDKNSFETDKFYKKLKYKLYLDDRLLVERIFPEDLREDKTLVEEVYLDINSPRCLRLVTYDDLYIVKIAYDNKTFYPNSLEFILEP